MKQGVKAVKYIGVADIRQIFAEDWAKVGVKGQDAITWSAANGFTVLGERLKAGAVDYLKEDGEFVILSEESTA